MKTTKITTVNESPSLKQLAKTTLRKLDPNAHSKINDRANVADDEAGAKVMSGQADPKTAYRNADRLRKLAFDTGWYLGKDNKPVSEAEEITEITAAQQTRLDALKEIGQDMVKANKAYAAAKASGNMQRAEQLKAMIIKLAAQKVRLGEDTEITEDDDGDWGTEPFEAYGVRGMKQTPFRKIFKNGKQAAAWCDKYDAEIHGSREVDSSELPASMKPKQAKDWSMKESNSKHLTPQEIEQNVKDTAQFPRKRDLSAAAIEKRVKHYGTAHTSAGNDYDIGLELGEDTDIDEAAKPKIIPSSRWKMNSVSPEVAKSYGADWEGCLELTIDNHTLQIFGSNKAYIGVIDGEVFATRVGSVPAKAQLAKDMQSHVLSSSNSTIDEARDDYGDMSKPFGVRWTAFVGREGRQVNKQKFFKTQKQMDTFVDKLVFTDGFYQIDSWCFPPEEQVNEISQDTKDRYLQRAIPDAGCAAFAKRFSKGDEKKGWERMEKNRKKGIARAYGPDPVDEAEVREIGPNEGIDEANEGTDQICMTVPLFIRCLEWAKESAPDDVALHQFTENIVAQDGCLDIEDYDGLIPAGDVAEGAEQVDEISDAAAKRLLMARIQQSGSEEGDMKKANAMMAVGKRAERKYGPRPDPDATRMFRDTIAKNMWADQKAKNADLVFHEGKEEDLEKLKEKLASKRADLAAVKGNGPGDGRNRTLIRSDIRDLQDEIKKLKALKEDASAGASCSGAIAAGPATPLFKEPVKRAPAKKKAKPVTEAKSTTVKTESGTVRVFPQGVKFFNSGNNKSFTWDQLSQMDNGETVKDFYKDDSHPYATDSTKVYTNGDEEHHLPSSVSKPVGESAEYAADLVRGKATGPGIINKLDRWFTKLMWTMPDNHFVSANIAEKQLSRAGFTQDQITIIRDCATDAGHSAMEYMKKKYPAEIAEPKYTSAIASNFQVFTLYLNVGQEKIDEFYSLLQKLFDAKLSKVADQLVLKKNVGESVVTELDNGPKGRVATDKINYDYTRNSTGGGASPEEFAKRKADISAEKARNAIIRRNGTRAQERQWALEDAREEPIELGRNFDFEQMKKIAAEYAGAHDIIDVTDARTYRVRVGDAVVAALEITAYCEYDLDDFGYDEETKASLGGDNVSDAIHLRFNRDPQNPKKIVFRGFSA